MATQFIITYINGSNGETVQGIPVNINVRYSGVNYGFGVYGATNTTFVNTTDGNGQVVFNEGFQELGAYTITAKTANITTTTIQNVFGITKKIKTVIHSSKISFSSNSNFTGNYNKTTQLVISQTTTILSTTQTNTTNTSISYSSTQATNNLISQIENDISKGLNNAQTDIEIIGIIGALILVIVLFAYIFKERLKQ